jgi:hypothetical protein
MAIIICSLLAACETNKGNIPRNQDIETDDISILTGKPGGIKLLEFGSKNAPSHSIPVNALLWRAALDIASFVPIDDVDTFGGSIVTEWYQSPNRPDQRLKLTFFVLGLELRSDAVKVQTYIQKKVGNDWVDSGRDEALARKLEDLILTRARELRAVSVSETMQ